MAATFQLTDGTLTLDFTSATDFNLDSKYSPKVAIPNGNGSIPPYVTETIPVVIKCTSENDLATTMQEFHLLQRKAAEYTVDQQQPTPVWLVCLLFLTLGLVF